MTSNLPPVRGCRSLRRGKKILHFVQNDEKIPLGFAASPFEKGEQKRKILRLKPQNDKCDAEKILSRYAPGHFSKGERHIKQ
jgi:hypothetical protein